VSKLQNIPWNKIKGAQHTLFGESFTIFMAETSDNQKMVYRLVFLLERMFKLSSRMRQK